MRSLDRLLTSDPNPTASPHATVLGGVTVLSLQAGENGIVIVQPDVEAKLLVVVTSYEVSQ